MDPHALDDSSPELQAVLESASRLLGLGPDAVLVGESAAGLYAGHRDSYEHEHVVPDLSDRFEVALDALESEGEWVTNRVRGRKDHSRPARRHRSGYPAADPRAAAGDDHDHTCIRRALRVPTAEETLRVKGFLIVRRNQTRDHLDVGALAERYGIGAAAGVLARIDDYYTDQHGGGRGVAAQVARQLADPRPADASVTQQLESYRGLHEPWTGWNNVRSLCRELAAEMVERDA